MRELVVYFDWNDYGGKLSKDHAGDFSALIWPNRRAQVMRQRLTSNWLFSNETWRTLVKCF